MNNKRADMKHRFESPLWPIYQLLWLGITPLVHLLYVWMALKHASPSLYFQRLAWRLPKHEIDVWMHAASVGEINALLPLILRLHDKYPHKQLMVSCNTPTAFAILEKKLPTAVLYAYMPLDKQSTIRRLLQRLKPRCMIIMETEIWPNLYRQLHRLSVPLLIVNARMSEKTLRAPAWIKSLYRDCLRSSAAILARSRQDCERFIQLGATPEQCRVVGNIKFHMANLNSAATAEPAHGLDQPYILVASSHDDEEWQICRALIDLERLPLLVVAPRHPHRAAQILSQLAGLQVDVAQRSKGQQPSPATRIYLADTLGELSDFIRHSLFVIMGGSFVDVGGHNILEVAAAKKAVVCGPDMRQFSAEAELLLAANGMRQCSDYQDLRQLTGDWLQHPEQVARVGQNAYDCMLAQQHILEDYVAAIQPFVAASS